MKKKPMRKKRILLIVIFAMLGAVFAGILCWRLPRRLQKKADLQRISSEQFNGIFLSMYPADTFSEEDFSSYRGLAVIKCGYEAKSLSDVCHYLKAVFETDNPVTNIYLGLDSAEIWDSCSRSLDRWNQSLLEELLPMVSAHPEVTFEILLSAPSMETWLKQSEKDTDLWFTTGRTLLEAFAPYDNIVSYFPASLHWLIENPGNYTETGSFSPVAAQKIMLFTFCDHQFQITPHNMDTLFGELQSMIAAQRKTPSVYPDLSEWHLVFFGDSVIGNYTGSLSIPGVVSGLSGADVFNCAVGGSPATASPENEKNFPLTADSFLTRETLEGKNLCFVINYGLNDYFMGYKIDNEENPYDASTYCGALRTGIRSLKEAYPEASVILAAPNYITSFSNGTEIRSSLGGSLTDYVNGLEKVAQETDSFFLNTYAEIGYDFSQAENYISDTVHLNEEGRFLFAERIIEAVAALP